MSSVFYEPPLEESTMWDMIPNIVLIAILFALSAYFLWRYSYTIGYKEGQESMRFDPPV